MNRSPFSLGYDAAALGLPRDASNGRDWLRGYDQYHDDTARSESARFV